MDGDGRAYGGSGPEDEGSLAAGADARCSSCERMRLSRAACWATQGKEGRGRADAGVEDWRAAGLSRRALEDDGRACPRIAPTAAARMGRETLINDLECMLGLSLVANSRNRIAVQRLSRSSWSQSLVVSLSWEMGAGSIA